LYRSTKDRGGVTGAAGFAKVGGGAEAAGVAAVVSLVSPSPDTALSLPFGALDSSANRAPQKAGIL